MRGSIVGGIGGFVFIKLYKVATMLINVVQINCLLEDEEVRMVDIYTLVGQKSCD